MLVQKIKKKMKSQENAQTTGFSGIFPAFFAGNVCLSKISLCHISDNAILHQCAKFHEKIQITARERSFFRGK